MWKFAAELTATNVGPVLEVIERRILAVVEYHIRHATYTIHPARTYFITVVIMLHLASSRCCSIHNVIIISLWAH